MKSMSTEKWHYIKHGDLDYHVAKQTQKSQGTRVPREA